MNPPVQTAGTETFGLPETVTHLIGKLRRLDPALLATILHAPETRTA